MIIDYLFMIYCSSAGFLQIASVHSGLRGLYFFPSSRLSFLSGCVLVVLGFYSFFSDGPNHIPDTQGGLDGNQQLILFSLGCLLSLISTLIISSIKTLNGPNESGIQGLDALRNYTYREIINPRIKNIWK